MRIIGVTGGVGAGKSTVLDYLEREKDACILKADLIGHQVMEPGETCYEQVLSLFGSKVIKDDKTIDRKKVSDVVFAKTDLREKLNSVIHPAVKDYILKKIQEEKQAGRALCVVEAALFLEEHYQDFCDEVWYVYADPEVRITRLMESRGYSREKALSIMASQKSEEEFRRAADVVLDNSKDFLYTERQIQERFC